jgi:hypothetical protein
MFSKSDKNISLSVREYLVNISANFLSSSNKFCFGDFLISSFSSIMSSSDEDDEEFADIKLFENLF